MPRRERIAGEKTALEAELVSRDVCKGEEEADLGMRFEKKKTGC